MVDIRDLMTGPRAPEGVDRPVIKTGPKHSKTAAKFPPWAVLALEAAGKRAPYLLTTKKRRDRFDKLCLRVKRGWYSLPSFVRSIDNLSDEGKTELFRDILLAGVMALSFSFADLRKARKRLGMLNAEAVETARKLAAMLREAEAIRDKWPLADNTPEGLLPLVDAFCKSALEPGAIRTGYMVDAATASRKGAESDRLRMFIAAVERDCCRHFSDTTFAELASVILGLDESVTADQIRTLRKNLPPVVTAFEHLKREVLHRAGLPHIDEDA